MRRAARAVAAVVLGASAALAAAETIGFGTSKVAVKNRRSGAGWVQHLTRTDRFGKGRAALARVGSVVPVNPLAYRGPEHGVAWYASTNTLGEPVIVSVEPALVVERSFASGSTLTGVAFGPGGFWFTRSRAGSPDELWTPSGPLELPAGPASPAPVGRLGAVFAYDGSDGAGEELWFVPPEQDDVVRAADILSGPVGSAPRDLVVVGERAFFTADDGAQGREPFVFDLATRAVTPLGDLTPGAALSDVRVLGEDLGALWFVIDAGAGTNTLWRADLGARTATQVVAGALVDVRALGVSRSAAYVAGRTAPGGVDVVQVRGGAAVTPVDVPAGSDGGLAFVVTPAGEVRLAYDLATVRGTVLVQAADPAPAGTRQDTDGDGFTDDVEIHVGTDPADALRTPFANAAARDDADLDELAVRWGRGFVSVSCILPKQPSPTALEAESLIVSAGGAVAAAYAPRRARLVRDRRSTIRRSALPDGRERLQVKIPTKLALRDDGPDGGVEVIVWRDAARHGVTR